MSKKPLSPISPRNARRLSRLDELGQEVASSNSSFAEKVRWFRVLVEGVANLLRGSCRDPHRNRFGIGRVACRGLNHRLRVSHSSKYTPLARGLCEEQNTEIITPMFHANLHRNPVSDFLLPVFLRLSRRTRGHTTKTRRSPNLSRYNTTLRDLH